MFVNYTIDKILDSNESVCREASIVVPKFCFEHWRQVEEPLFRNGKVQFDEEKFIHSVLT